MQITSPISTSKFSCHSFHTGNATCVFCLIYRSCHWPVMCWYYLNHISMSVLIRSPLVCALTLWAGWLWVSSLLLFLILPSCSLWQSMLASFGARWYRIDILAVNILWLYYVDISLSYFPIEFALWANYLSAIWLFVFCSQIVESIIIEDNCI